MKFADIQKKILAGEELSEQEKEFLKNYKEPKDLSGTVKELEEKVENLEKEKDEKAEKDLTEAQKLQKTNDKLIKERDELKAKQVESEFESKVSKLAATHKCNDVGYLKYTIKTREIKIDDETAASEFMDNFKKEFPKFFDVDANNGGGGSNIDTTQNPSGGGLTEFASIINKGADASTIDRDRAMDIALKMREERAKEAGAGKQE